MGDEPLKRPQIGYDSPEMRADVQNDLSEGQRILAGIAEYDRQMDLVYAEELDKEHTRQRESIVITLDSIPPDVDKQERVKKLEAKLEIYTQRLADGFRDADFVTIVDSTYKRGVLRTVLKDGSANTWALSNAMMRQSGGQFVLESFETACRVVDDYIKTGGKSVRGGGGL